MNHDITLSVLPTVRVTTKSDKVVRSPFFYVGDKYKLMPQLREFFPSEIDTFYDVFCGGGSASINSSAKKFVMNDIDEKIIELHRNLQFESGNIDSYINKMHKLIKRYKLSHSEKGLTKEIESLKKEFKKTYFSKYNKSSYILLRDDYNKKKNDTNKLYLLLIYGFNHMIRFNKRNEFNLPVGNVDWNRNVTNALYNYSSWFNNNNVHLSKGMDFEQFVESHVLSDEDFLYFDPPYLITFSEYNKLWSADDEVRLYNLLDQLTERGIKWGLSNMVSHKGNTNHILLEWAVKYEKFRIESNYISRFDNSVKKDSKEIYVTNFIK